MLFRWDPNLALLISCEPWRIQGYASKRFLGWNVHRHRADFSGHTGIFYTIVFDWIKLQKMGAWNFLACYIRIHGLGFHCRAKCECADWMNRKTAAFQWVLRLWLLYRKTVVFFNEQWGKTNHMLVLHKGTAALWLTCCGLLNYRIYANVMIRFLAVILR